MGKISYEAWRGHICRILVSQGHVRDESKISTDIYRPYYEDGISPAKAVREDLGMNAIRYWDERGGHQPGQ